MKPENNAKRGRKSPKHVEKTSATAAALGAGANVTDDTTAGQETDIEASIMGDVSEDIFFDLADSFIELANQHSNRVPVESISAAMMYAASRYNAFLAISEAPIDRLEPETAADYYSLQYRKMFEDNLDEYIAQNPVADEAQASDSD